MYAEINNFIQKKIQSSNLKKRSHIVDKNPEVIANSILSENPVLGEVTQSLKKVNKIRKEVILNSDSHINTPAASRKKEVVWLL